jgi:hypothetical protein
MNSERNDCDDELPISITHSRDTIVIDGNVEQDYRFLVYRFRGPDAEIFARTYLDDPWVVAITSPPFGSPLPTEVIAYLRKRFDVIRQLGGPEGYTELWRA